MISQIISFFNTSIKYARVILTTESWHCIQYNTADHVSEFETIVAKHKT